MPGRPRKPTQVLELVGAFKKNPQRKGDRENEPRPEGLLKPTPPTYFTPEQKKVFREIVKQIPPKVATTSDKIIVEITAVLLAKFRSPDGLMASELSTLTKNLSQLGMTPADRSKIKVPGSPQKENPFKDIGRR